MYIGAYYPDNPQSNNNGINLRIWYMVILKTTIHPLIIPVMFYIHRIRRTLLPSSIKVAHVMPVHFMNIETNGITYG